MGWIREVVELGGAMSICYHVHILFEGIPWVFVGPLKSKGGFTKFMNIVSSAQIGCPPISGDDGSFKNQESFKSVFLYSTSHLGWIDIRQ
jgi:hypothetical protein